MTIQEQWFCHRENELAKIAEEILGKGLNKKIALSGELGSGKTTLIRYLCRYLGVRELVTSPTFTILNEYNGRNCKVYHFDFYRIERIEEIYDLGYEEYLFSEEYVFIEWPGKLGYLLPEFYKNLKIEVGKNQERIFQLFS